MPIVYKETIKTPDAHEPSLGRIPLLVISSVVLSAGASVYAFPQAETLVVGSGGAIANCSESTIQAAIDRASRLGGHHRILVTDDVADGVWHESLRIDNVRTDLALEIVGGFKSCTDLTRNGGRSRIDGGQLAQPVLEILGRSDLTLRDLSIEGSTRDDDTGKPSGITFEGHGRLELASVVVANHQHAGIEVEGVGGEARLELVGNVDVLDNQLSGVEARGNSVLTIRGDGNTIQGNNTGVYLLSPAIADIGATGDVLVNNGMGLVVRGSESGSARTTRLYSTDPSNPFAIAGNALGAIVLDAQNADYRICANNIAIVENDSFAIYVGGRDAVLDINGECGYPAEAAISCPLVDNQGECSSISGNVASTDQSLIEAVDGARITIDRMNIRTNSAASLLSTDTDKPDSTASIVFTRSVVADNDDGEVMSHARNRATVAGHDVTRAGIRSR